MVECRVELSCDEAVPLNFNMLFSKYSCRESDHDTLLSLSTVSSISVLSV